MRHLPSIALALALLVPAAAAARQNDHPAACIRIAHQLAHYENQRQRAEDLGNDMWVQRFETQLDKLEKEQASVCPEDSAAARAAERMKELMALAARGAVSFFTMGAF